MVGASTPGIEHHFEHYSRPNGISGWKLGELYRQKEANKNAIVFVCNRKPFWEAGILPLNYSRVSPGKSRTPST
jgi:hypothetical protein